MPAWLTRNWEVRMREAALAMAAALLGFASVYGLRHLVSGLCPSLEVLAVALALSLSRARARARPEHHRSAWIGFAVIPVTAIGASEIGELFITAPALGDVLFVLAVCLTIFMRRYGERARRVATFIVLPVISVLIVPAPAVAGLQGPGASRWWAALVAVIVMAWVTLIRALFAGGQTEVVVPARAPRRTRREGESRWRLDGPSRLALQMGVALGGAFALGHWWFGEHWAWCVLSAFIVSSANRGREDVLLKASQRVIGAGVGAIGATLIAGTFPAGDALAIGVIFVLLGIALWLRPLNYAFWAAGMTGALALLYGYYGEGGASLIGDRVLGVLVGAALGVASAWLLWPIRVGSVIRRDVALCLAALDRLLETLADPEASAQLIAERGLAFRRAVAALEYHRTLLRAIPAPLRRSIDHLPALDCLAGVSAPGAPMSRRDASALRRELGVLRKANGAAELPDAEAYAALAEHLDAPAAAVPSSASA